ncbi:MAG: choice-of-anchor L domain-containing protein [Bacteroidia bacterium]|nr:choice-of-anchor L domain-containing protein [Bacteroidia bacterium]
MSIFVEDQFMNNSEKHIGKLNRIPFLAGILACSFATAQLTVNNTPPNNNNPAWLVQNVLTGSGVQIMNVTFNGAPNTIGFFNGQNSNIGINSGVILSCGTIFNAQGQNNQTGASQSNNLPGDPDLDIVFSPTLSYDATILEFDFIPMSDTVRFRYCFASEEYMEYVSSMPGGINDGFGFFISGPGINGPFSNNAKNIALVPSPPAPPNTYVTMFNVNCNPQNSPFYICNDPQNSQSWANVCPPSYNCPTSPAQTTHQYDGQTVVLTAESQVICGQTYHIKIAIADGGDHILDSGVFLEAGSFSSSGVVVGSASSANGNILGSDSTVYEGCGSLVIYFDRGNQTITQDTVSFQILGSAGNGTDYANIPNYVIFQIGQDSVAITITPTPDNNNEGPETIILIIPAAGPCNNGAPDTIVVTILDVLPISLGMQAYNDTICAGDPTSLEAFVLGGMPGYTYQWSHSLGTTPLVSLNPGPMNTTSYSVTVTDTCGNVSTQSINVHISQPLASFTHGYATVNTIDFTNTSTPAVSYFWDFGDGNTSTAVSPSHTYPNDQTNTFTVMLIITDAYGCTDTVYDYVTVYPDFYFWAPNAFTPNNDGHNATYGGIGVAVLEYEMLIFNRWGELVFKSNHIDTRWDGTYKGSVVPEDTYVATFKIKGPNNIKLEKITHVSVVR